MVYSAGQEHRRSTLERSGVAMCWAALSTSITRSQRDESGFPRPTPCEWREPSPRPPRPAVLLAAGVGGDERRDFGGDRGEPRSARAIEQLPAVQAVELAREHLEALVAGPGRLVHRTSFVDRGVAVVGGDHEHGR